VPSAWESDDRPHQPCVVCFGVPDRVVELPELPDVHVAFASSALCGTCAGLAAAGDANRLTTRARAGWKDEPDAVSNVVRLVLAWAGHRVPAEPPAAEEHRHQVVAPLSPEDEHVWLRLEPLIYDGPSHRVTVHGRISYESDDETSVIDVFRDGPRTRVVGADGEPWVISDGVTTWSNSDDGMVARPYDGEAWSGQGIELAARPTREDVDVFGFGTPIGPIERVTYLGRPAWQFRFAAPSHKPFDMRVVVDDETGLVLDQRYGDHSVARWLEFRTDEPLTDDLFTWTGPVRSQADLEAARWREHEQDMAGRSAWFARNVTEASLEINGVAVEVNLHEWDDDGSFQASTDGPLNGSLARRVRSDEWWALNWSNVTHRWSDSMWDWALSVWDDGEPFDNDHFAALRSWLGTQTTS
jgi:hypothetical protein